MQVYSYVEVLLDELFHEFILESTPPGPPRVGELVNKVIQRNEYLRGDIQSGAEFNESISWAIQEQITINQIRGKMESELLVDMPIDKGMRQRFMELVNNVSDDRVPEELLQEVSFAPGLIPMLHNPRYFLLALQSNHIGVLNSGITDNLRGWEPCLYTLLKEIWRNASRHIHPFQKGATHQGTHHCHVVNKNLNKIGGLLSHPLTIEEGFILKVAAAIHDLGKAHIEGVVDHEISGYNYTTRHPSDLCIPLGLQECVALIVRYHDGVDQLDSIASPLQSAYNVSFTKSGTNYNFIVNLRNLAAIFRLADVLDMTNERVSDVVFEMSRTNPPTLQSANRSKILCRKCVKSFRFNVAHHGIDVNTLPGLSTADVAILDGGLAYENNRLNLSTTATILSGLNIPNQLHRIP